MIDLADLQNTARIAYESYKQNPQAAVRSSSFIRAFHDWCIRELLRTDLPPTRRVQNLHLERTRDIDVVPAESAPARRAQNLLLEREVNVLGGYVDKTLDLALWSETSGPLLALSVKSQMSSISANARNRFEEYFADAANLHTRFPMLAFGFLLILPYETASGEQVIDQSGQPTPLAWRVLRLLQGVSGRIDPESQVGHYEETALLLVDFNATPVQIHPSFPDSQSGLRIENFFDRLVSRFWQRNPTLRRDSK